MSEGRRRITLRVTCLDLLVSVACTVNLGGCGNDGSDPFAAFRRHDPLLVVLRETQSAGSEEVWWSLRTSAAEGTIRGIVLEDNLHRDDLQKFRHPAYEERTADSVVERTYHVYLTPSSTRQHSWNIENDEPNLVYRCTGETITLLTEHVGRGRDSTNRIMPPGQRPPPSPEWHKWAADPVVVGFLLVIVLIVTLRLIITRGGKTDKKYGGT